LSAKASRPFLINPKGVGILLSNCSIPVFCGYKYEESASIPDGIPKPFFAAACL
jgi:hypothetical protein